MRVRLPIAVGCPLALLASSVPGQTVHRVGPGHLATIQAAVDAAAPKDVVLVAAGAYPGFVVGKPLTITAEPGAFVQVVAAAPMSIALGPADRVHLAGLDIEAPQLTLTGGMTSMERCTLRTATGVRCVDCMVALRWSSALAAAASAVRVQDSYLHASEGVFATAAGGGAGVEHGAIEVVGAGRASLSDCGLFGGWPATAPHPSAALHVAAVAATSARVWLVDCTLVGGFHPLTAAVGAAVQAPPASQPAPVRLHRATTIGALDGAVAFGHVIGVRTSVDMRIGAPFTTTMTGDPGDWHVFYGAAEIVGPAQIPVVEQPALGFLGAAIFDLRIGDAQGNADFTFTVPNDPQVRHATVWWRGVDIRVLPWQATPAFVTVVQ